MPFFHEAPHGMLKNKGVLIPTPLHAAISFGNR